MPIILIVLLILARGAHAETQVLRGATQGTTYHIKFVALPGEVDVEQLHADVKKVLAKIDRQMSTYRSDSELSRFNRARSGEWFPVSAATTEVVLAARDISEKTGGALDVTVGPLVRLWHFGPKTGTRSAMNAKFMPPSADSIREAQKLVGYLDLHARMEPPALRKDVEGLEVDLSSIGSGYTIDRLAELLLNRGIKDFMVELGGEVRASGNRADGTPWRIAIERPLVEKREMETAVPLVNAAAATAGGNRNFFEHNGRRYSHIIDPATGRPVEHSLASVTVVADSCTAADGWDTPLLVLGPERGYECAAKHGVAALFMTDGSRNVSVRTTPAWKARFGE